MYKMKTQNLGSALVKGTCMVALAALLSVNVQAKGTTMPALKNDTTKMSKMDHQKMGMMKGKKADKMMKSKMSKDKMGKDKMGKDKMSDMKTPEKM